MPTSATPNETELRAIVMQILAQQLSEHAMKDPVVYVDQRPYSLEVTYTSGDTSRATLWQQDDLGIWQSIAGVVFTSDMTVGASC